MSEFQKRVQNLNLEMSQLKDENKSNLANFIQGGIQALQSLHQSVTDEHRKSGLDFLVESNVAHFAAQRRSIPIDAYLTYTISHL